MNIREKIQERLDGLQGLMERQDHLRFPELVTRNLEQVTKFWSALDENEREFLSAIRIATTEQISWNMRKLNSTH